MSDDLDAHYRLLGLEPGASLGAVIKAYSRLALANQPDGAASPEQKAKAVADLQALNEAYEALQRQLRTGSATPTEPAAHAPIAFAPPKRVEPAPLRSVPTRQPPPLERDAAHGLEYWETGNADTDLLPGEGVTIDDATAAWLKTAGLIVLAALIVYMMVSASMSGS